MEKLSPAVLEAYGIHSRSIKKEKGHYLCDTASGLLKVHTTPEPVWDIERQHQIKEHLAANGFPHTDRYKLTQTGQPYALIGRETYVVTTQPRVQRETDLENETEVLQAVQTLARFHAAAKNIPQEPTPTPISPPLTEVYTRHIQELAQALKQARRSPRMSDFDVALIKHAPYYNETMQDAIQRLSKTHYAALYVQAVNQNALCHNNLKEENLPTADGVTYIINFSQAAIDLQLCDLAALIRRYAQRSSKALPALKLLDAYNNIASLPHAAADILYAQLIFPWAFMKTVTQYYSKKRNWAPNGLISRIDMILEERDAYEQYISVLQ